VSTRGTLPFAPGFDTPARMTRSTGHTQHGAHAGRQRRFAGGGRCAGGGSARHARAPAGQRDPSPAGRRRGGADRGALAAEPSVIEAWRGFRRAARARLDPAMPPGRAMIVPAASVAPTARAMRARARRAIYPSARRPSPPARGPSARRRSMCRPRAGACRRSRGKARIARGSRADHAPIALAAGLG
jgi:hypothetical protein